MEWMRELAQWVVAFADSGHGSLALFLLAFAESSFFPIPPDLLLIALVLVNPEAWLFYAGISTVGSALGGLFGYGIGFWGGRPLLHKVFKESTVDAVEKQFKHYDVWAICVAGFTPIPYKLFTLSGGACALNILRFFVASFISRGARFIIVAGAIAFFGERAKVWLSDYFDWISIAFVVVLIAGFLLMKMWAKQHALRTNEGS